MKYLSLFTGIGGFEVGIMKASKEAVCIGYSEIDKYASVIYQKHFPKHKNYGDITRIEANNLPDFDLICGGFPCQSFSIAGKRKGFQDTRGTLFFDIVRILKAKRPRLLLLENVKGLLSHDDGNTFKIIIATLDELGYDCQWQVLNSKNFGVPQNRERVFIVGHLRGTPRPEVFPLDENSQPDIILPTLTARYYGAQTNGGYIGKKQTKIRVGTLRTHKDGNGQPVIIQTARGFNKGGEKEISPTMGSNAWQHNNHLVYKGVRRLTPIECERLQGFPDDWTSRGGSGAIISDTQRYKCCGNAVTTNVVQAIMERVIR